MNKRWSLLPKESNKAVALAEAMTISPRLAQMLLHRGITEPEAVELYLYGGFADLSYPEALLNLPVAVEKIMAAIDANIPMAVYGDYDVDGICASVLLHQALVNAGADGRIYIPSRQHEGYGLNTEALEQLWSEGYRLLITVDNGIAAADILAPFIERGMTVIVTDHHQLPERLPGGIVINPLLEMDEKAPYRGLCGAGVAFMLARAVLEAKAGHRLSQEILAPYLMMAAVATVADIVPLQGDNRLLVKCGLEYIHQGAASFGLQALIDVAGIDHATMDAQHIAFQLAPRINACGRLDRVALALQLFHAQSAEEAAALAVEIDELNNVRKNMEKEAFEEAKASVPAVVPMSILAVGENWHAGVIGIVASRLMEHFQRPALVITPTQEAPDVFTGSGRAPDGFHLYQALQACSETLEQFGGHAKAAGFRLKREDIGAFQAAFEAYATAHQEAWFGQGEIAVEASLKASEIDQALWAEVLALEPTGCQNKRPCFVMESVADVGFRPCGKDGLHLQVFIQQKDSKQKGIAFRKGDYPYQERVVRHDILFTLTENNFQGQRNIELLIEDIRPSYLAFDHADNAVFADGALYLQEDGYAGIEDSVSFVTKVVGVSFEERQERIAALGAGDVLTLRREADNPYDAYAIAVDGPKGSLGYLKRGLALRLAPLLDKGISYKVAVLERTGGEDDGYFGMNILCEKETAEDIAVFSETPLPQEAQKLAETLIAPATLHQVQRDALAILAEQQSLLLVMGTGRGKSLVYQSHAAALALQKQQVTVVFFPLRALLEDQYLAVQPLFAKLGLETRRLFGDSRQSEREAFLHDWAEGSIDLVLTTPEYFLYHQNMFASGGRSIGCFVFDEAHYLSSRREGYRALAKVMADTSVQILAMTATLSKEAEQLLMETLPMDRLLVDEHQRSNLRLVDQRGSAQKPRYLLQLLKEQQKTIVYMNSRKGAFDLAGGLRSVLPIRLRGQVSYYHGGLPKEQRTAILEQFRTGHIKLLIATTAFGEGMNIPDVRHVVMYHVCFSDAAFNQLAGRAGRDGEVSYIHLLYGQRDASLNERILKPLCPNRQDLGTIYKQMIFLLQEHDGQMEKKTFLESVSDHQHQKEAAGRHALRIFLDLALLKQTDIDGHTYIEIGHRGIKAHLEDSALFMEGREEWDAFQGHLKTAFGKERQVLLEGIQKPLVESRRSVQGGDQNGSI